MFVTEYLTTWSSALTLLMWPWSARIPSDDLDTDILIIDDHDENDDHDYPDYHDDPDDHDMALMTLMGSRTLAPPDISSP